MQSAVVKRSIVIVGHKTSVSLENEFWNGLKEIGREYKMTLSNLVADIDTRRLHTNLSSAIRLFVLQHFRLQISKTAAIRIEAGTDLPPITQIGRPAQQVNGKADEHPEQ